MTTQNQRSDDFERLVIAPLSPVFVFLVGWGTLALFIAIARLAPVLVWVVGRIGG